MNKDKYNVIIIGAGNIGALYDNPKSNNVLSHAHAFKTHEGFNLLGFIDSDYKRTQNAAQIWETSAYNSLDEAILKNQVDVVCISTPDKYHYSVLKEVALFPVKLVFTEKPLTKTEEESIDILNIYQSKKIPLQVNYTRRFVNEFHDIKTKIKKNIFGKFLSGTGHYGKGILHNGSHLINLLRFLIDDIVDFSVLKSENDYYDDDPSVTVNLVFKHGQIFHMQHISCLNFTIFDIDLFFENAKISISDSGHKVTYYKKEESAIFKGYYNLSKDADTETNLYTAMYLAANNIYNHLYLQEPLYSPASDAYVDLMICNRIISSSKKMDHKINLL